jgi:Fic family protein
MEGVRGDYLTPGEFRRSQNWIGPPGCTLLDATYVPPPVQEMLEALTEFERYLHVPDPLLPPLVRLALIHYQFEAIHPFLDGNGRVGRLLITLLLCAEGLLTEPLLYLSAFFERYRDDYYRHLLAVSQAGLWTDWLVFFLRGVAEQARDAVQLSNRVLELQNQYRGKLRAAGTSALLPRLADELFARPVMTISQAASLLQVTWRTAKNTIRRLEGAGILVEITGQSNNRVFVAEEILNIVSGKEQTG